MMLSVLVALILSPAITPTVMKPRAHGRAAAEFIGTAAASLRSPGRARRETGSTAPSTGSSKRYLGTSRTVVDRKWLFLAITR